MASRMIRADRQYQDIGWYLLLVLVIHFLSPCALSPQTHAKLLYQAAQAHHTPMGHCTRLAATHNPSSLLNPAQKSNTIPAQKNDTIPVCCVLVYLHRAAIVSPIHIDIPYFSLLFPLSPTVTSPAGEMQLFHPVFARHFPHSPPLYLLHTALLI